MWEAWEGSPYGTNTCPLPAVRGLKKPFLHISGDEGCPTPSELLFFGYVGYHCVCVHCCHGGFIVSSLPACDVCVTFWETWGAFPGPLYSHSLHLQE